MTRRTIILIMAALLFVAGILLLAWLTRHNEPAYAGRTLSSWFSQYVQAKRVSQRTFGTTEEAEEALAAIRAMGTNALPWLLREAFATEPVAPFGSNRVVWVSLERPAWIRVPRLVPRLKMCGEAVEVVIQLRLPADVLLNSLNERLRGTNEVSHRAAIRMLGGAGERAETVVPLLVEALQSTNVWTQYTAIQSLNKIGPAAEPAIPSILEHLTNSTFSINREVIATLGNLGPKASAAVPGLDRLMRSAPKPYTRAQAAVALCQITGNHPEALEMIRRAMFEAKGTANTDGHPSKAEMTYALSRAQAHVESIIPRLLPLVEREREGFGETQMYTSSIGLLMTLAPERAAAMWEDWMRTDPREYVRVNAAHQVLLKQPTNEAAVKLLCDTIDRNLRNRAYLISYLGEAHPSSRLARETLEGVAATNSHPVLRDEARRSLDRIRRRNRSVK